MKRFSIKKVLSAQEHIPFWMPWGLGKWVGQTLLFLLLLLLFIALFCLPERSMPEPPPPDPDPIDTTVVPPVDTTHVEEPVEEPEPVVIHTGDVQVLLEWDTKDDLDLHVTDPFGETIYYQHKTSASGGTLDVDANAGTIVDEPKENVYWPTGGAPSGRYKVEVELYKLRTVPPVSYRVKVKHGEQVDHYSGTLFIPHNGDFVCAFDLE